MSHHEQVYPDYGTGEKKLGIYLFGLLACVVLTLMAFWAVMANAWSKWEIIAFIYGLACVQFITQLICFLRLNVKTMQAKTNVMILVFTGVILTVIVSGSLWIMLNLHYNMWH